MKAIMQTKEVAKLAKDIYAIEKIIDKVRDLGTYFAFFKPGQGKLEEIHIENEVEQEEIIKSLEILKRIKQDRLKDMILEQSRTEGDKE